MEIEKALNRSAVSGASDSGTSSRSFGTLLTWLSDHDTPVFVIATSNNFLSLPPELIRKGRFTELFWLDLPSAKDRYDIFTVILKKFKRDPEKFNIRNFAKATDKFTGAEIENVIISAMFQCYANNRSELSNKAILDEIGNTVPQAKINEVDIKKMRDEARGKLRFATDEEDTSELSEEMRNINL